MTGSSRVNNTSKFWNIRKFFMDFWNSSCQAGFAFLDLIKSNLAIVISFFVLVFLVVFLTTFPQFHLCYCCAGVAKNYNFSKLRLGISNTLVN